MLVCALEELFVAHDCGTWLTRVFRVCLCLCAPLFLCPCPIDFLASLALVDFLASQQEIERAETSLREAWECVVADGSERVIAAADVADRLRSLEEHMEDLSRRVAALQRIRDDVAGACATLQESAAFLQGVQKSGSEGLSDKATSEVSNTIAETSGFSIGKRQRRRFIMS